MAQVDLINVNKVYPNGVQAVFDFNLHIDDKEFIILVGPSGCGKSTTLRMIAGLEDITSGDLIINGKRMNDVSPKDRGIAMVFQSYALYPHMTVYDNMAFGLQIRRMKKEDIQIRVREASKILGLEPFLSRYQRQLSSRLRTVHGMTEQLSIKLSHLMDMKVILLHLLKKIFHQQEKSLKIPIRQTAGIRFLMQIQNRQ